MKQLLIVVLALVTVSAVAREWLVSYSDDPASGALRVTIGAGAEGSINTLHDPVLAFVFKDDELVEGNLKMAASVHWGGYIMSDPPLIEIAFSEGVGLQQHGRLDTTAKIVFFPDSWSVLMRLLRMGPEERVAVTAMRTTGEMSTAWWTVGDLATVIMVAVFDEGD